MYSIRSVSNLEALIVGTILLNCKIKEIWFKFDHEEVIDIGELPEAYISFRYFSIKSNKQKTITKNEEINGKYHIPKLVKEYKKYNFFTF